jgi:DNA invertase Pin-like site-specific DNA recombinase
MGATLPSKGARLVPDRVGPRCFSAANGIACCRGEDRNAVKHLSDGELDLMHAATLEEMKRRGRTPQGVEKGFPARPDLTKIQSPPIKTAKLNAAEASLTRGQVNAVRSAFKAGITPSRIAREFGISQSDVRKALASDETKR